MAKSRSAWTRKVIEASTSEVALTTARAAWRAGRKSLFDIACARDGGAWIHFTGIDPVTPPRFRSRYSNL